MYFLGGRFGGGSRLVAVLQLADFLLLILSESLLTCLRLFLCGEFHHVVHGYLTLDRLAHLYLVLVIVVYGLSVYLPVREAVATAFLHIVQNELIMRSFS